MKILAVDLGKVKSVACDFATQTGEHVFETCRTAPEALEEMVIRRRPDRLVIEVGQPAGSRTSRPGCRSSCRWPIPATRVGVGGA